LKWGSYATDPVTHRDRVCRDGIFNAKNKYIFNALHVLTKHIFVVTIAIDGRSKRQIDAKGGTLYAK